MRPGGALSLSTWRSAAFSSAFGDADVFGAGRVVRRVGGVEVGQALGQLERGLEAVGEARLDACADDEAVDHHLDVVLVLLVERRGVLDLVESRRRCGRG